MTLQAPHRALRPETPQEHFLIGLFDRLWARYRRRMVHVRTYEALIAKHGASFTNDHIAFRTLACQEKAMGIFSLSRIFEALGYVAQACYTFPDKHLSSIHYQYPKAGFPKLFITQLETWALSPKSRGVLLKYARAAKPAPTDSDLAALRNLEKGGALLARTERAFSRLPWPVPQKKDVLSVNEESQFGAWVLVNGHDVNHFTASVDSHGVESLDDIEKTAQAMADAGVPMKIEIEGARGSRLRQTSTEAVTLPTPVMEGKKRIKMPWSYAYFEIIQRPLLANPTTGRPERFEGFLGGQATNLFEMTKRI